MSTACGVLTWTTSNRSMRGIAVAYYPKPTSEESRGRRVVRQKVRRFCVYRFSQRGRGNEQLRLWQRDEPARTAPAAPGLGIDARRVGDGIKNPVLSAAERQTHSSSGGRLWSWRSWPASFPPTCSSCRDLAVATAA